VTETYSLAVTGAGSGQKFAQKVHTLPDSGATPGAMARAQRLNLPLLTLQPDGSQVYFTLEAERSTPANPILRRV
jgi:hypothetical protein